MRLLQNSCRKTEELHQGDRCKQGGGGELEIDFSGRTGRTCLWTECKKDRGQGGSDVFGFPTVWHSQEEQIVVRNQESHRGQSRRCPLDMWRGHVQVGNFRTVRKHAALERKNILAGTGFQVMFNTLMPAKITQRKLHIRTEKRGSRPNSLGGKY